jgi:hypothetical protein
MNTTNKDYEVLEIIERGNKVAKVRIREQIRCDDGEVLIRERITRITVRQAIERLVKPDGA